MNTPREELVVLLDENGQPIGTAPKSEVHHGDTPLHLAFSCYVFDHHNRFLLTQRSLNKKTWPAAWTNSCCGHPTPGESVIQAVRRRARQELNIELDEPRLLLPDFRYRAVMDDGTVEHELCPVYWATCLDPTTLDPDPNEVAAADWVDWTEFCRAVLERRRQVSPWCLEQLTAFPAPEHHPIEDGS